MEINESTLIILLAIFCARVIDVSIGTMRIIFLTRGLKTLSALIGFFESLIWIIAISQVMNNVNSWAAYLAFAGGFASGNVVGIWLEEKIALGTLVIRIITQRDASTLVEAMRGAAYNVTRIDAEGGHGQVMVLFTIVRREQLPEVIALIRQHNPQATYTVENIRFASSSGPEMAIAKRPLALQRFYSLRT